MIDLTTLSDAERLHLQAIHTTLAQIVRSVAANVRNDMHRQANYARQSERAAQGNRDAQDWLDGQQGNFNVWTNRTHTMAQLRTASCEQLEQRRVLYATASWAKWEIRRIKKVIAERAATKELAI